MSLYGICSGSPVYLNEFTHILSRMSHKVENMLLFSTRVLHSTCLYAFSYICLKTLIYFSFQFQNRNGCCFYKCVFVVRHLFNFKSKEVFHFITHFVRIFHFRKSKLFKFFIRQEVELLTFTSVCMFYRLVIFHLVCYWIKHI